VAQGQELTKSLLGLDLGSMLQAFVASKGGAASSDAAPSDEEAPVVGGAEELAATSG
jgi:hypothetical protein